MLVAESLYGDFFQYVGDFLNVLNRSPTSQSCHQYILPPTSTYIDVVITIITFSFAQSSCRMISKSEVIFGLQTGRKLASKWMVSFD